MKIKLHVRTLQPEHEGVRHLLDSAPARRSAPTTDQSSKKHRSRAGPTGRTEQKCVLRNPKLEWWLGWRVTSKALGSGAKVAAGSRLANGLSTEC